ncbi:MAG: AMP-binding protein [Deltaproteobacteria bacterium]|nr:AMP-binding protein [Deltaproteobacteria bacterium]MBW2051762.1 AMP-binding protein [Deltaproteobacteria bacterium]MBW2140382.1 AMP-binding protein [Deltaproteobacteria bacterium]MBW2322368.1 AMP-binding protein [Deltaproteobacteria bacterium]
MGQKRALTYVKEGKVETRLSFNDLGQDSDIMARELSEMGLRQGDCVVLFLPKCVDWVITHLAVMKNGAISVPLNPAFKKREVEYFLNVTTPKLTVAGIDQAEMIREIDPGLPLITFDPGLSYERPDRADQKPAFESPPELSPADPGVIIFTSGTTGQPKGAVLTQGNLSHDAQNIIRIWEISEADTLCHALPLFHAHGLCFALHTCLLKGASMVMLDAFDADAVLDALSQKEGELACSIFMAVPTMYSRLIERAPAKKADFSHLRLLTSGSAPLLAKDFSRIKEVFNHEPVEREGMSETGMNFSNPIRGKRVPGSIGLPLPELEVRVIDPESLEDVSPGQTGELWLKGPGITPGYWLRPEETEKAFVDGWFRTGDLGRVDEAGYYFLSDRIKHIIISGGENISPREIEQVIDALDGVRESSVVGLPDPTWGEKVVAAVILNPGSTLTADQIKAHLKSNLLDWKCPKKVIFVNELPKNQMGKILKEDVKGLFEK